MEKQVVITKRFRNNTLRVYQYLLKEFSARTAENFLLKLEQRIDFVSANPTVGKLSGKVPNVCSVLFTPHNQIFYRYQNNIGEILCLFDMRKNPREKTVLMRLLLLLCANKYVVNGFISPFGG